MTKSLDALIFPDDEAEKLSFLKENAEQILQSKGCHVVLFDGRSNHFAVALEIRDNRIFFAYREDIAYHGKPDYIPRARSIPAGQITRIHLDADLSDGK